MERKNYSLSDKLIGTINFLAHIINPQYNLVNPKAIYFIDDAQYWRLEREKEQEAQGHRDYYNRSRI